MDYNSIIEVINKEEKIQQECLKTLTEFNKQSMGTQIEYGRRAAVYRIAQEEILNRAMDSLIDLGLENKVLKNENEYLLSSANLVDKAFIQSMHEKHKIVSSSNEARNEELKTQLEKILRRPIKHVK